MFFIGAVVLLNAIGAGLIIPVTPELVATLAHSNISDAAAWGGYIAAIYAVMQFLFGPAMGALSDRWGRRPILLISLAILALDYLVMTFAQSLWVLFTGRLLAGIASATYATAYASISDISQNGQRATRFGMVGALIGLGFVIGPAIGGLLATFGLRVPFYIAAVLLSLTLTYGLFYLPETLAKENRRPIEWKRANPIGAAAQVLKTPVLHWFFGALILFHFANFVYPAVWPYFTIEALNWTTTQVGLSLAIVGIGFSGVKGGLIRWAVPRHGEAKTALFGFAFGIVAMIGFAFASTTLSVVVLLPLSALGALIPPSITALMCNLVPDDRQGELQGALTSVMGLTLVLSTLMMTQLFTFYTNGATTVYFPGAPFLLAAVLMVSALLPFVIGLKKAKRKAAALAIANA
nr:MFS transporter [Pseudovibrio flavus]